ncbi:ABC transporter ATP-binding protein [Lactonifactor longoviformis]|uniref:ATP-binding cassette, subfamily B n=1 Tax=Lactonifactor longoviformis DSM 17459 TaxID=1122155 RepID=A0A1M4XYE8_9CLOT|nr:ATP-binding cassette, subfamily B [Lactonifactor longoviformis DSM 17459]
MIDKDEMHEVQPDDFGGEYSVEKAKDSKKTAFRLVKRLAQQKWKLLLVLASIVISSVLMLMSPKVIGAAIDQLWGGIRTAAETGGTFAVNFETMGAILFVLLGLYLLDSLFSYIQQNTMAGVSQTLSLDLRKEISGKMNRLPLRYFDRHKKGEILSRVTSDIEKIADTLQDSLTQLFASVVDVVGAFGMMLWISPVLTLIAAGTIVLSMVIAVLVASKTERSFAANQECLGRLNGSIEESFTGNTVIKAFNLEKQTIENTEKLNEDLYHASSKAMFLNYAISPIIRLVGRLGYVVIAIRGAISVMNGRISIGDIQAFIQYVNQVTEPVTQVSYTLNTLQGAVAAAERVFELLDEEEEIPDAAAPRRLGLPKGDVRFEHVRFGYSDGRILMQDISIDVKAGSKVAIVGPTGAGKTTLVNLLMRFYELQGGHIFIDGVDIADMKRDELRSLMGIVLQDSWLFGGSIRENIVYSRENATDGEVYAAAKAARADHFIRTMPQGYDTVLSDEITSLSQGQRQLLTIARAILADPAILILDEATSSVDTRTELEIQKAMDALMKGRTSFVIAHRLSTIRDADCILVMDQGTIIEQGSHKELMELGGFYADLYNSQFAAKAG